MDDFFAPPPRRSLPEPAPRYRGPDWMGPPLGVLPGVVESELVLARTASVAVCLTGIYAYPTGLRFELVTMGGPGSEELELDPHGFMHRRLGRRRDEEDIPPEVLRFGVELPNGQRVTNIGNDPFVEMAEAGDEDDDGFRPRGPVLMERGGGGGGTDWHRGMWLWPLPGPGTMVVVCEWPAAAIPLTRTEVDLAPVLAAAQRAQTIFEFPEPPDEPGRGSFAISPG